MACSVLGLLAIARGIDLLLELPHLAAQPGNLAIHEVHRARGLLQAGLEVLDGGVLLVAQLHLRHHPPLQRRERVAGVELSLALQRPAPRPLLLSERAARAQRRRFAAPR